MALSKPSMLTSTVIATADNGACLHAPNERIRDGMWLEMQAVLTVFTESRERFHGIHFRHTAVRMLKIGTGGPVAVKELGYGVVEEAVAGAVDGDPVGWDAGGLVVVDGLVERSGGGEGGREVGWRAVEDVTKMGGTSFRDGFLDLGICLGCGWSGWEVADNRGCACLLGGCCGGLSRNGTRGLCVLVFLLDRLHDVCGLSLLSLRSGALELGKMRLLLYENAVSLEMSYSTVAMGKGRWVRGDGW